MTSRSRLTLKEKVDIINVKNSENISVRELAARFKVGKTQVSVILKRKDEIIDKWQRYGYDNLQNSFPKPAGLIIDNVTFEWFCRARASNIPISGPLIREKALEVARILGENQFKASAGWLDRFKIRHSIISFKTFNDLSGCVGVEIANDWIEELKYLCVGFALNDIYNCDETGLFFKAPPDITTDLKVESCLSGEFSDERLTVLLCTNMYGEFEQPLVVGSTNYSEFFKGTDLNVDWQCNGKAWMTKDIMTEWLTKLNKKMALQNRNILLFMDNAASHPLKNLSNVKVVFWPSLTTSICQPLDQGIINNFKVNYRKFILEHLLNESALSPSDKKEVNMIDALHWISSSIDMIDKEIVIKCFLKSGFLKTLVNFVDDMPDRIEERQLNDLLKVYNSSSDVTYADIDTNIATEDSSLKVEDIILDDSMKFNEIETPQPINSFDEPPMKLDEVILQIDRLKKFFMSEGNSEAVTLISSLQLNVQSNMINSKIINENMD